MGFELQPISFVIATCMGAFSAHLAHKRGRNPYGWFCIGFLFGLLGILAVFFISPKKGHALSTLQPKPEPTFQILGPSNKFWYYLDPSQQQQGPMSFDALSRELKQGKISLSTYVWHEELSDWKPLQELVKASP